MSAKALFCTIAACLISACAQMPGGPPPGPPPGVKAVPCPGASCDVEVSVKCDYMVFCKIEAPEWVSVPRNNSPVITWALVTPGYTFSDNGIAFASGSPLACQREGNTRFMCKDTNTGSGTYKYTITLKGFPFVLPRDPWIQNE